MIAISAEFATDSPKVGPIDSTLGSSASPKRSSSAWLTSPTSSGASVSVEIWTTLSPSSGLSTRLDLRVAEPLRAERVADVVDARGALERRGDPRARLEVDAEVDALAGDRQRARPAGSRPTAEKNHFDAPMKSKRDRALRLSPAPSAERLRRIRDPRMLRMIACVASTAVNSDSMVPMTSTKREALDPRRGEDEEDERDEQRDDVGVDDRREALLVARGEAARTRICPARTSSFTRSKIDDVRVGRHPQCEDQARDARQRQRDRDQLDDRVEVERVDDQRDVAITPSTR